MGGRGTDHPDHPTMTGTTAPAQPPPVPVPVTRVDDDAVRSSTAALVYAGTWRVTSGTRKYRGADHYSAAANSTVTLTWTGRGVAVYGAKAPWHGKASISVDGGASHTVNCYAPTRADQQLLFTSATLAYGRHRLVVHVTGTKVGRSAGTVVSADRFDVS